MARLPPGFRFHPTDVELVMYYLKRKILGKKFIFEAISELNIYKFCPWDLPDKSCLRSKDLEWYFFCPRERKYASGVRTNRATENGYWKATGKDRSVVYNQRTVGMVKTLVFHQGHPPNGKRTDWVIHEYRIDDSNLADAGVAQAECVLCKVFQKSGPGPQNGAQYGAPYNEEDWDDDVDITSESLPVSVLHNNENSSVVTSMITPEAPRIDALFEQFPSTIMQPLDELPLPILDGDEITSWLAMFVEDNDLLPTENDNNEKLDDLSHERGNSSTSCLDGNSIYNGLGDLSNLGELTGSGFSLPRIQANPMHLSGDVAFLELSDLDIPLCNPTECNGSEGRSTDALHASCNCHGLEQFFCGGAAQQAPTSSQTYVLPNSFHQQQDHSTLPQLVTDRRHGVNHGNDANSYNVDYTHFLQWDGSWHDLQDGERGGFHYSL